MQRPRRRWLPALVGLGALAIAPVVARIPVARQHGWAGAVPMPLLVAVFPLADRMAPLLPPRTSSWVKIGSQWRFRVGRPQASPLPFHVQLGDQLGSELLRRVCDDTLREWEWWLAVECALRHDSRRRLRDRNHGMSRADGMLSAALYRDRLTPDARRRADRMSVVRFDLPASLPSDVPVTASLTIVHWRFNRLECRIIDRRSGAPLVSWDENRRRDRVFRDMPPSWDDDRVVIGRTGFAETVLPLTVELRTTSLSSSAQRLIRTYDTDVTIPVSGTIEEAYELRAATAVNIALNVKARVAPAETPSGDWILWYSRVRAVAAARTASIDTVALRLELRDEDRLIAEGFTWWPVPDMSDPDPPGMIGVDQIDLRAVGPAATWEDDRTLFLHIIGDPVVASRRPDARVIWDGHVVLPVVPFTR